MPQDGHLLCFYQPLMIRHSGGLRYVLRTFHDVSSPVSRHSISVAVLLNATWQKIWYALLYWSTSLRLVNCNHCRSAKKKKSAPGRLKGLVRSQRVTRRASEVRQRSHSVN